MRATKRINSQPTSVIASENKIKMKEQTKKQNIKSREMSHFSDVGGTKEMHTAEGHVLGNRPLVMTLLSLKT